MTKGRNIYLSVNIFQFEMICSDIRQQLIIRKVKYSWNERLWIETIITHTISLYFKQPLRYKQSPFTVMHTQLGSYECSRNTTQLFHKKWPNLYTYVGDSIKSISNRPPFGYRIIKRKISSTLQITASRQRDRNVVYIEA